MTICSGLISSGSLSGKGSGKNSNLSRLCLFFDRSVDRKLVKVVDYPKFMEEKLEKYCGHNDIGLTYIRSKKYRAHILDVSDSQR